MFICLVSILCFLLAEAFCGAVIIGIIALVVGVAALVEFLTSYGLIILGVIAGVVALVFIIGKIQDQIELNSWCKEHLADFERGI